jgi:hypothetical protein
LHIGPESSFGFNFVLLGLGEEVIQIRFGYPDHNLSLQGNLVKKNPLLQLGRYKGI